VSERFTILTQGKQQKGDTLEIAGFRISWFFNLRSSRSIDRTFPLCERSDVALLVHNQPPPPFLQKEYVFDSEETWAVFRSDGKLVLQNAGLHSDLSPSRFLVLAPDLKSGALYVTGDTPEDIDPLGYPLNQVLWILLLSKRRGLLFHACGIDDQGMGYLFLGNSGDGKSTTARLWFDHGVTVLNDDRIIVSENRGELWMYGTPWHGDFKEHSSHGLPIHKLFFLRHGRKDSCRVKRGAEAVSMLLARSFPPFWEKEAMAFTIEFCQRLVGEIPCYELTFVPDAGMIDFVRNIKGRPTHRGGV
jgi:hypothetical protein